jgi:hypothetical protein
MNGAAPVELVIRLVRGGSLGLTFLDERSRTPLARKSVEIEQRDGEGNWQRWDQVRTDRDGHAGIEWLPEGRWRFRLEEQTWHELILGEGESVSLVIVCVAPGTVRLRGRITDHGRPVVGAKVEVWGDATTTDGSGGYEFDDLRLGADELSVSHPDFGPVVELPLRLERAETRLDVELALRSIDGRVLDLDGRPLAGVEVALGAVGDSAQFQRAGAVTTGADGAFEFGGVSAYTNSFLEARAEGRRLARVELPDGDVRSLELRLELAAMLTLVLEHAQETLVLFGTATATWQGGELPSGEWVQEGKTIPGEPGQTHFRFAHLAPGPWRLEYGSFLSEEDADVRAHVTLEVGENAPLVLRR